MGQISLRSPVGDITVFDEDEALVAIEWGRVPDGPVSPLLEAARQQLDAYFDGTLKRFDLPLRPKGTAFQVAVWRRLSAIPYGGTATYGKVAADIGGSARAVGGACGANPLPIIIPCHRVTAANGNLSGYSGGEGPETKVALLRLEGAIL